MTDIDAELEFIELASLNIRRVRTAEGAEFYGQPIGTIITADMIAQKRAEAKAKGVKPPKGALTKGVSAGSSSSGGGGTSSGSKSSGGGSSVSSAVKNVSPAKPKATPSPSPSQGNEAPTSVAPEPTVPTISGPSHFQVGETDFTAPQGSKLIRPKNKPNMAYILTPEGEVHAFNASGEVPIPEELKPILSEKFKNLSPDDEHYQEEELDSSGVKPLSDTKVGDSLTKSGKTMFVKTDDNKWENEDLGLVLTDDDLQGAVDSGEFTVESKSGTESANFSEMTPEEISEILDGYETGKKLNLAEAVITKNEDGSWKSSLTGNDIPNDDISTLVSKAGVSLSDDVIDDDEESTPDAPEVTPDQESPSAEEVSTPTTSGDTEEAVDAPDADKSEVSTPDSESLDEGDVPDEDANELLEEFLSTPQPVPENGEAVKSLDGLEEVKLQLPGDTTATLTKTGEDSWEDDLYSTTWTSADLAEDIEAGNVWVEKQEKETPSEVTGMKSTGQVQAAIDALEAHSGFQIKYGLKSLPDDHPLKSDQDYLDAQIEKAKADYPDLSPKAALIKSLKVSLGQEDDDDSSTLSAPTGEVIRIGASDSKATATGDTGGSFTEKDIEDAIQILENFQGKIFKAELNKQGNPLGKLSPNHIVGFNKDKTVTKQKFIDLLKKKLDNKKSSTPETDIPEASEIDTPEVSPEAPEASPEVPEVSEEVTPEPEPETVTHGLIGDEGVKKIGGQAGSNVGGLYEIPMSDGTTKRFYVKKAQTKDHGNNEALANALYLEVGSNAPNVDFASDGNIYSEIVDGKHDMAQRLSDNDEKWLDSLRKDYAIDAWLSNRDVFGLTYDNILTDEEGNPWKIDNGGALTYRAQGQKKLDFMKDDVSELDIFRSGKKSAVFGKGVMTEEQEMDGVNRLAQVSPERINELVEQYDLDSELAEKLIGRRKYILDRYNVADPYADEPNEVDEVQDAPEAEAPSADVPSEAPEVDESDPKNLPSVVWNDFVDKPAGYEMVSSNGEYKYIKKNGPGTSEIVAIDSMGTVEEFNLDSYTFNNALSGWYKELPQKDYPNGITPGKYNTGKGAKASLWVKPDGTGYYQGMKGVVKELDAEGVKKNYDAGMSNLVSPVMNPEDYPEPSTGTGSTVSTSKQKSIPTLGSVDTLPDGTYKGPGDAVYIVKGDTVITEKPVKKMEFSSLGVGKVPDAHFVDNAPAGTKMSYKPYLNDDAGYVVKNEHGGWEAVSDSWADKNALAYISSASNPWGYKHNKWKIDSFPGKDSTESKKSTLKTKYLQGQLIDPETETSVYPPGHSGNVTFFGGATDVASLSSLANYLADPDVPISEKQNGPKEFGVPVKTALWKAHILKKNNLESFPSAEVAADYYAQNIKDYLADATVPTPEDPTVLFNYDADGYVPKPIPVASASTLSSYDKTGEWTARIKLISSTVGDGKVIGVNMAGATKDQKVTWVSHFNSGDFAAMYALEVEVAQNKGKSHPTGTSHPGHPNNPSTHKITWGAAVPGEVPAGVTIEGNWSSLSVDASMDEINNYLILAKMQNPTYLGNTEKRHWVTAHRKGNKSTVDQLSAIAQSRKESGVSEFTDPPVWKEDVQPAKSYDSMFDDTQFPQNWAEYPNYINKAPDFFDEVSPNEPELEAIFQQKKIEHPFVNINSQKAEALNAWFAKQEADYLEELNKPDWTVVKSVSEGSHPTFIIKDKKSDKMKIFKPLTPGKEWRAESEVVAHNLGAMYGLSVPQASIGEVNDGLPPGINNKGILMDFAPNVGSMGNVDGTSVDVESLTPKQLGQLAAEHVFDWLLDNDDTHDENILIGEDGNIVAIDKGRAFVQYGHWHGLEVDNLAAMSVNTHNSPSGKKNVVYADMIQAVKDGNISQEQLDEAYKQAIKSAKRIQRSSDDSLSEMIKMATADRTDWSLPSYAEDWDFITPHPNNQDELIQSVLNRKNSLVSDFEEFYDKLYAASGFNKPEPPAKALGENHLSGWEEPDVIAKAEEAKAWGVAPIHSSAGIANGSSLIWTEKDADGKNVLTGKMHLGTITQKKVLEFIKSKDPKTALGSPELEGYPDAQLKSWKKSVTAVGKDISANATTGAFNQGLWDEMKATEEKVDADLDFVSSVDVNAEGFTQFPSGVTVPNQTVPQYALALQHHKELVSLVETAKAEQVPTDKSHFQSYVPPKWKGSGLKYVSPEGWTYKELDNGLFVEVKDGKVSLLNSLPEGSYVSSAEQPEIPKEKYTLKKAGALKGVLGEDGTKSVTSEVDSSGHPGKEYEIALPTGEVIHFRNGSATSTTRSQRGMVRFRLNKDLSPDVSLANVQNYLETAGVDVSGADEEQAENVYWRQMFQRLIGSNVSDAPESVQKAREKLIGMRKELSDKLNVSVSEEDIPEAIGLTEADERTFWYDLAVSAWGSQRVDDFLSQGKHLPKYQHMDLNDPEKSTGIPYFQRVDVDLEKIYGQGTMLAVGNTGKDDRHFDYIKSGGLSSTEERLRLLGYFKSGVSSAADQDSGGANAVFTRVAKGSALKTGALVGSHVIYWSPEVMSMVGTYSYSSDMYGNVSHLHTANKYNPLSSLKYSGHSNETMVPNNISLYDFMEIMVFDNENKRLKAIEEFKQRGIEKLRGLPIEDRLVNRVNLDAALAKIKASWKK